MWKVMPLWVNQKDEPQQLKRLKMRGKLGGKGSAWHYGSWCWVPPAHGVVAPRSVLAHAGLQEVAPPGVAVAGTPHHVGHTWHAGVKAPAQELCDQDLEGS